jgi:N-acyl-D-amino-acid deacylase
MIASDAGIARVGVAVPHPRAYGTNARVLSRYVHDQKVIRLEEAIRRMTSLPAQKFHLTDRGLLREGMAADILLLKPEEVMDQATFSKPHQFSKGFEYVLVNGKIVVDKGVHTKVRSGQVLRRKGIAM